ncbi:MAG: sigma-70 family RNA polymerase sigma factor [Deltaproteobacteria bacterium]|nr:sigma-70 family RNA polymerase sigma factor [Deltaproteobacteria bacterium]
MGRRTLNVIAGGRGPGVSTPGSAQPGGAGDVDYVDNGGEVAGLRELYGKYGGSVYGRCHYLLKNHAKAEDAMQDVFAKALINMAGFRAEASPLTWLTKIATNHCLNLMRAEQAPWHQTFEEQEAARANLFQEAGPAAGPRLFENREAVRQLLDRVDVETQAAAIHYYVDEMTLEEVAATVGRSVPTVRKRLAAFVSAAAATAGDTDGLGEPS